MRKLIEGILDFRRHVFPAYRMTFARLAGSQSPDCLFIACADSRVVPNLFASTQPGDLFVMRNIGNVVPPAEETADHSVGAAIEFAVKALGVKDVVVCGHSNCGAMKALLSGRVPDGAPHLAAWLEHGHASLERFRAQAPAPADANLPDHDRLSRLNVLQQMQNVESHPAVKEQIARKALRVHGWWFDIGSADVFAWEPELGFVLIDETESQRILDRLDADAA